MAPIRFGPWSTLLSLGVFVGLVMALALVLRPANRTANRLLAALMLVVALKMLPYAAGYAGFYGRYPWLSFAPVEFGLALGPLLWLHVVALTTGRLPPRWGWHLLPAALQGLYYSLCFVQPLAWKNAWNDSVHAGWVSPPENVLVIVSIAVYLRAAWQRRQAYEQWLQGHVSNLDEHRFTTLRNLVAAMALWLLLYAGFEVATRLVGLDYYDRFPLYLAMSALLYALGLEGWRQADRLHPHPHPEPWPHLPPHRPTHLQPGLDALPHIPAGPEQAPAPTVQPVPRQPNWQALGAQWRDQTAAAGWWRDPELGLDSLARQLGTNTHYLSRAFNEGLGANFAQVIADMRVAWVKTQLEQRAAHGGDAVDLLSLAFEAGFSSKTSFNRVFKAATGQTPSAWRAAAQATARGAKS